jgi:hypothetical protein
MKLLCNKCGGDIECYDVYDTGRIICSCDKCHGVYYVDVNTDEIIFNNTLDFQGYEWSVDKETWIVTSTGNYSINLNTNYEMTITEEGTYIVNIEGNKIVIDRNKWDRLVGEYVRYRMVYDDESTL